MSRVPLLITLGVAVLARAAAAESCGDPSALRTELEQEASRARYSNLAWRIGFPAGAVGQFAVAASGTVGYGTHRACGSAAPIGRPCAWSPRAPHAPSAGFSGSRTWAAWRSIWGWGCGGRARLVEDGLLAFGVSYLIGLLSTYTMPRASWDRSREPAWTANIVTGQDPWSLVVGGSF